MNVFEIDQTRCTACMGCLIRCPNHAIGIKDWGVEIHEGRCISCGACVEGCSHGAVTQLSQLDQVKQFIATGRKVILSIDPACIAFLPPNVTLEKVAAAVQKLGFWDTADASEAVAAVASEYARLAADPKRENLIFSACPVIQNLMERCYPELLGFLAPVASPMIAHGRMLKHGFTSAAVVHVGTCAARIAEAQDVRHSTEVNAVLSVEELVSWLRQEKIDPAALEEEPLLSDGGGIGELAAFSGGMLECMEYFAPHHGRKKLLVQGMESCIALLDELKAGNLSGCVIEMDACPGGCVGGNGLHRSQGQIRGRFAAEMAIRDYVEAHGRTPYFDTAGIALANPTIDFSVPDYTPSERCVQGMLSHIGVAKPEHQKNCGLCGYRTCRERAEAILWHREPVSICRQVVEDSLQDIHGVTYDNLPMAALLIDDTQRVVEFNREASELFGLKPGQEKYIFEIMDPGDVQYVLSTGLSIRNKRADIPELLLRVSCDLVPLKELGMVLGLFSDITQEENREEAERQSRLKSVEMAQKVIDKQMTVAQQIAFLLGETTAETKVTLNQLKTRIMGDEEGEL